MATAVASCYAFAHAPLTRHLPNTSPAIYVHGVIQVKYEFEDFMAVPGCCVGFHDDASGDFINPPPPAA